MQACARDLSDLLPAQREKDSESSLMHYRARSFDPRIGRFIQKDPVDRVRDHYVYVRNSPTQFVDPSGERAYWIGGAGDKSRLFGIGPSGLIGKLMNKYMGSTPGEDFYEDNTTQDVDRIVADIKEWHRVETQVMPTVTYAWKREPLIIIGHSWGGSAAMRTVNKLVEVGIKVDMLITLDPVAMISPSAPKNQRAWINVWQKADFGDFLAELPGLGQVLAAPFAFLTQHPDDAIATVGRQLGHERGANENIVWEGGHENPEGMLKAVLKRHPFALAGFANVKPVSSKIERLYEGTIYERTEGGDFAPK